MSLAQVDAITGIGLARLSVLERLPPSRLTPDMRRRLAAAYSISEEELGGGSDADIELTFGAT